ncbi:MAG: hypothetical protein AABX08_04140 [Nanoarchaeota archaeon]
MISKKAVILILALFLVPFVLGQTHYFDYGYGSGPGFGASGGFGFGFISQLCDNYAEWFEFFVLFVVFFIFGHWTFKGRSRSDVLAVVIAFALALGIVRWEAFSGYKLVCGLGDIFSGIFGGFIGLIFILLLIIGLFAALKGSNATRTVVGLLYLLFWFWMLSEGGYRLSSLFYYLPLDPFFVSSILNFLALVAALFVVIFGWKWLRGE